MSNGAKLIPVQVHNKDHEWLLRYCGRKQMETGKRIKLVDILAEALSDFKEKNEV